MIINEDDYLEHFGVKGMKWGVRKKQKEPRNKNYTSYNRRNDSFKYRKQHPNTKLSNNEILKIRESR